MTTSYAENRGLLTSEEAMQILAPYMDGLREDFKSAWAWVQQVLEEDPDRRVRFDLSTQAAMVFDCFVHLSKRRYEGHTTVTVKQRGRMLTINFGGGLLLRFKKFDKRLRSNNIKTNAQALIYYQLSLPGMDPATHVTFGYTTDATGRNVTGVHVTCPIGWRRNKWSVAVEESAAGTLPLAPVAAPETDGEESGFVLEPKEAPQRKSEGE